MGPGRMAADVHYQTSVGQLNVPQVSFVYLRRKKKFGGLMMDQKTKFVVRKLTIVSLAGNILLSAFKIAAGLVGGLGVAQGANIGLNAAVFEPVHGSAPDIKGQNKANPTALLLSAIEMLKYIEQRDIARKIEKALFWRFLVFLCW